MKDKALWNLKRSQKLIERMIQLSEEGVAESQDNGCLLLYAVLRDCAARIQIRVEAELENHKSNIGGNDSAQFQIVE